jgi:hypothetical protein
MELSDSIVRNSYIYRFVSLNCCVNLNKFASVPLSGSSCAAVSLTRSKRRSRRRELPPSMETPPDGYRRNVGICLVNPSKKVINFAICFIWIWFFAFQLNLWLGFMVLGVNLVDIYCFQDKHSVHVADASGSSYFQCWNLNSILFWGIWQELMRIGFGRYFSMWILNSNLWQELNFNYFVKGIACWMVLGWWSRAFDWVLHVNCSWNDLEQTKL